MDCSGILLDNRHIVGFHRTMNIRFPEYELYGEAHSQHQGAAADFWVHCEAICDRSRLHGWEIRPHSHRRFIQLLYIWGGSAEILTPGTSVPVQVPAVIEVPRLAVHGFRFTSDVRGFVLSVVPEELRCLDGSPKHEQGSQTLRQTPLLSGDPVAERLERMLRDTETEYELRGIGHRAMLDASISASLMLIERLNAPDAADTSNVAMRDMARIRKLHALIAAHFRNHRPAGFYAAELGISSAHLNRLCRRETGSSVLELVVSKTIDEACRSLVFSVHSVKQIAYNLGFEDPAYFTRFFIRHTGTQPTAYRRAQRQRLERYGQVES